MKVLLDANVVVSFLLTRGKNISAIFDYWDRGKYKLLMSNEIFYEYEEVIERLIELRRLTRSSGIRLLGKIKRKSILIKVIHKNKISKDENDNRYINCAHDGKANYLVTKDEEHLIPLKRYKYTSIISPKDFLIILNNIYPTN